MGRLIHLASLPLRIVPPASLENIKELVFRTVPSANKVRHSEQEDVTSLVAAVS